MPSNQGRYPIPSSAIGAASARQHRRGGMFGFDGVITENTMCIPDQHMACPRRPVSLCSANDIGVGLSAELFFVHGVDPIAMARCLLLSRTAQRVWSAPSVGGGSEGS